MADLKSNDSNPEAKRQKLMPTCEISPTANITDLNDDCLLKIFELLELEDHLNIANANKYLNPAASWIFNKTQGEKTIFLEDFHIGTRTPIVVSREKIYIRGLNTAFKFLRCFGRCITKLEVNYFGITMQNYAHIIRYLKNYCATSLTEIKLFNAPEFLKNTQTSFPKVESVRADGGNLGSDLAKFAEWFPELRRLELVCDEECGYASFPHLENLSVQIQNFDPILDSDWLETGIAQLIRLNHLQSLCISFSVPVKFINFLEIIGIQPLLTKLTIRWGIKPIPIHKRNLARFVYALPSLIELNLRCFELTVDAAVAFIRQLKFLKKFEFRLSRLSSQEELRRQLHDEWQLSIKLDVVTLER